MASTTSPPPVAVPSGNTAAWLLPVLFFVALWVVLLICCGFYEERCRPVREKIGLERKFRKLFRMKDKPLIESTTRTDAAPDTGMSVSYHASSEMRHDRQAMLRTYRNTIIDNMETPSVVASNLAQKGTIPSVMCDAVTSQPTPEDQSRKLLDILPSYGDASFDSFCTSLREQEQLHWLADTLEGEGMSVSKKMKLGSHRRQLVDKMNPDVIIPHLFNNGVFTRQMVNCCVNADSPEEKNARILHLLPSRSDRDFGLFCTALRTDQQSAHLADLLEEKGIDLNTAIMDEEAGTVQSSAPIVQNSVPTMQNSVPTMQNSVPTMQSNVATMNSNVAMTPSNVNTNSTATEDGERMRSNFRRTPSARMDKVKVTRSTEGQPGELLSVSSVVVPVDMPVILDVRGEVDRAQWKYNGETVNHRPGFRAASDGFLHELHIDRMTPDLEGTYICQGYSPEGGIVSCEVKVNTIQ